MELLQVFTVMPLHYSIIKRMALNCLVIAHSPTQVSAIFHEIMLQGESFILYRCPKCLSENFQTLNREKRQREAQRRDSSLLDG